jgi:GNAT superfamily N-acetyltransferase
MGIVPRMAIRWDWLQPLITVPYVPALGPVHPETVTPGLLADVTAIAGTGRFLPYDKDLRWGGRKDESVLAGAVVQEPGLVLVPVLSTRRASCVKVCVYNRDPREALSQAAELGGAARASFSLFAEKLAADGFAFLDARIRGHGGTGPVLTCQRDGKIAGAIGPMEIMADSRGAARLLPQYFGVLPEYRGLGLGRSLWRAAMGWGQRHRAAYQLLQTEVGGASDSLCRSEGLTDLGTVCATPL